MITIGRTEERDAARILQVHVQSWRTTYEGVAPEDFLVSLNEGERGPQWQEWPSTWIIEIRGR